MLVCQLSIICHIQYCHLRCEMLRSSQGVLGLNREAAPEDEGYEGHARTHQQYEVLNALSKGECQNSLSSLLPEVPFNTIFFY